MKKTLIIFCIATTTVAHAQTKKIVVKKATAANTEVAKTNSSLLKTSIDSFSYAVGMNIANNLQSQGIQQINFVAFQKAMTDVFNKKTCLLDQSQAGLTVQKKFSNMTKEAGKKYLAENKKHAGVIELPSGLQYEVIKQGTGPIPKATDTVKAHYAGSLINGQEFDNSYKRGEPIQIPVTGVIQGWVQALQLMPVGSKWKLYIPSELGYGDRGAGTIPPGSVLIFEIELLDIVHK